MKEWEILCLGREEGYLARCEKQGRVRELAQTERAREQLQQREARLASNKRAAAARERGLSRQNHIVPRSLLRACYSRWTTSSFSTTVLP